MIRIVSDVARCRWVMYPYGTKQWRAQEFCSGGSTNSVEDRGQKTGIWGQ